MLAWFTAAQQGVGDFRRVGQVGEKCFIDLHAGFGQSLLEFFFKNQGYFVQA